VRLSYSPQQKNLFLTDGDMSLVFFRRLISLHYLFVVAFIFQIHLSNHCYPTDKSAEPQDISSSDPINLFDCLSDSIRRRSFLSIDQKTNLFLNSFDIYHCLRHFFKKLIRLERTVYAISEHRSSDSLRKRFPSLSSSDNDETFSLDTPSDVSITSLSTDT
jgi:hypothetical protein